MRIGIDARKIDDYGIGTYIEGLTCGLIAIAPSERFVLLGSAALKDRFDSANVETIVFDDPLYSLRELFTPRLLASRAGLDVFHEPHYTLPFVTCRRVVTVHDLIHLYLQGIRAAGRRTYARMMIASAVSRADVVMCVSRAAADELLAAFDVSIRKVHVVPNGVDAHFRSAADFSILTRFGVEREGFFLWVGNDKPHKNVDRLVAAYRLARQRGVRRPLVLAGNAPERFRSEPGVILAGRVSTSELHALYAGATALLFVSLSEGFGLPLAESMAAGTPALVSDIAVLREVAGGSALRVDPRSVESIASGIERIGGDATLRDELARRAIEQSERFDWNAAAQATLSLYRA